MRLNEWNSPARNEAKCRVMARCNDLFDRIVDGGKEAIEQFIADRESERFFLDFKRASNNGRDAHLTDIDRNNLAKAISGFGNSEGGVIVWGVDCSRNIDGSDVARFEVPIENPRRFCSQLEDAVSGCTIPPHTSVESIVVMAEEESGFVVTLIPSSNSAPHQTISKNQYYVRTGSSFAPTPHSVLAGMFGRRPQPHVFHNFNLALAGWHNDTLKVSIGLVIYNEGPGIASDVFSIVTAHTVAGPNCHFQFEPQQNLGWSGMWAYDRRMTLISPPDFRLPPGAPVSPLTIYLSLRPPFDEPLKIVGSVGSGQSVPYDFVIENNSEAISTQYERCTLIPDFQLLSSDEKHDIASRTLGIEPDAATR